MECPDVVPTQEEQDRWDVVPLAKDVPQPISGELLLKQQPGVGTGRRDAFPMYSCATGVLFKIVSSTVKFSNGVAIGVAIVLRIYSPTALLSCFER